MPLKQPPTHHFSLDDSIAPGDVVVVSGQRGRWHVDLVTITEDRYVSMTRFVGWPHKKPQTGNPADWLGRPRSVVRIQLHHLWLFRAARFDRSTKEGRGTFQEYVDWYGLSSADNATNNNR